MPGPSKTPQPSPADPHGAPPVLLRHATEADLPAIVTIYNAAIATGQSTADTEPQTVDSRLPWFRDHSRQSRPIWVAQAGGAVIGWLSLQSFQGRPGYNITAEVSAYIARGHRRHGVATLLLRHAIAACPALGLRNLLALVFKHNAPSIALFTSLGFQQMGYFPRVAEIGKRERDLVIFGLRLAGDPPPRSAARLPRPAPRRPRR
ncbi:MAG: N-acetyltransferase family protein [Dehalococcoidia bacterium]|nr:N-acetyltransferase family protein [Dehalococcoidia bacterium]